MSYKYLEHATDALIEVNAKTLEDAFSVAGKSVVETIIDSNNIQEIEEKNINVKGRNLINLLYNWLEEIVTITITDGFAIKNFSVNIKKNKEYQIVSKISGEKLDLKKHNFKVEIKSPTFHLMEINENDEITMRYLLDL
ncbi:MAG: protein archease [Thaumarchaeota archaeon]|nr:MAG: protein archease [Nitrososphaerota archaeon]HIA09711.1 archease [Candidatus Nitrosopelagicus sp.]HIA96801.1 archease [Candidatus Nitrosopelagicus sp.]HIC06105.1 archease [Candidatus Nitrosopelagicus sp.]HIO85299.1 archease [Candidatus Nitrosopelagicus sp.]